MTGFSFKNFLENHPSIVWMCVCLICVYAFDTEPLGSLEHTFATAGVERIKKKKIKKIVISISVLAYPVHVHVCVRG